MAPDTRTRLLDAARELFSTQGYAETSTRAIASQAGCNLALISHYFGSKEGLFRELLVELIESLEQNFAVHLATAGDFESKIRAFVGVMVDSMDRSAPLLRMMHREIAGPDHPLLADLKPSIERFKTTFHKLIEEARTAGHVRAELDPQMCGLLLGGMIQHYFALYPTACQVIGERTDARVAEIKRHITEIFLGGVVRRNP